MKYNIFSWKYKFVQSIVWFLFFSTWNGSPDQTSRTGPLFYDPFLSIDLQGNAIKIQTGALIWSWFYGAIWLFLFEKLYL